MCLSGAAFRAGRCQAAPPLAFSPLCFRHATGMHWARQLCFWACLAVQPSRCRTLAPAYCVAHLLLTCVQLWCIPRHLVGPDCLLGTGRFMKAVRLCVTGAAGGPAVSDIMAVLGPVLSFRLDACCLRQTAPWARGLLAAMPVSRWCGLRLRLKQEVSRRRLKQVVAASCPSATSASGTPASLRSRLAGRDDWPHLKGPQVCNVSGGAGGGARGGRDHDGMVRGYH